MARYTSAYSSFLNRMSEVEILRELAAQKERKDPINLRQEVNSLCRGSLILLCSHLEAFIKELGEITLEKLHTKPVPRSSLSPRIYFHISKDIIYELKNTNDPDKVADKMFRFLNRDAQYWSKSGYFPQPIMVERFNKGFSNPAFPKIKDYFKRFGYVQYSSDLEKHLKGKYKPTVNMVNHLVDTRNKIAHGDPMATETPSDVKSIETLIQEYCRATDSVFASWCGDSLCKIR